MTLVSTLAQYLAGEFDNRDQAIETPVWFVHLRLWHRPVYLFGEDSPTLFAEQANMLQLDQPYRQRLLRLQQQQDSLTVQYYKFHDPSRVKGAGQDPTLLESLTENDVELLPGCFLQVTSQSDPTGTHFRATPLPGSRCRFTLQGSQIQVALGFEATIDQFWSHDKGIDPETEQPIWGAIMGAYEFRKRQSF
jgi:hypothetical protein